MDLSVIIPVFEEREKIARDIEAAAAFLQGHRLAGEIIVVDDGSRDDTTVVAQNVKVAAHVKLNVIRYEHNQGKGFAIQTGVSASQGDYVMFADSGLCVPYHFVEDGLNLIKTGACEIAHGSRKLKGSQIITPQAWPRRLTARMFRWLAIWWLKIPAHLTDTQCGFKIYRGEVARELYGECRARGFIFDIEIIMRALRRGYRILEFPITWTCDRDSRLSLTRSPAQIWRELIKIRHNITKY